MRAIPGGDNHRDRQEACKEEACDRRDARAHGCLDNLVAELVKIVSGERTVVRCSLTQKLKN
jgi:hypothetical protein